jgi:hypothetical protein
MTRKEPMLLLYSLLVRAPRSLDLYYRPLSEGHPEWRPPAVPPRRLND